LDRVTGKAVVVVSAGSTCRESEGFTLFLFLAFAMHGFPPDVKILCTNGAKFLGVREVSSGLASGKELQRTCRGPISTAVRTTGSISGNRSWPGVRTGVIAAGKCSTRSKSRILKCSFCVMRQAGFFSFAGRAFSAGLIAKNDVQQRAVDLYTALEFNLA
jgi:hypothetical protein